MSIPLSSVGNHSTSKNNEVLTNVQIRNRTCCRCSFDGSTCPCRSLRQRGANASWTGDNYTGATTDIHLGYEGEVGAASYYVQAGPAIVAADGAENSTRFSGKAGLGIPVSDSLSAYGELSFITAEDEFMEDLGVGGKLGVKYNF